LSGCRMNFRRAAPNAPTPSPSSSAVTTAVVVDFASATHAPLCVKYLAFPTPPMQLPPHLSPHRNRLSRHRPTEGQVALSSAEAWASRAPPRLGPDSCFQRRSSQIPPPLREIAFMKWALTRARTLGKRRAIACARDRTNRTTKNACVVPVSLLVWTRFDSPRRRVTHIRSQNPPEYPPLQYSPESARR